MLETAAAKVHNRKPPYQTPRQREIVSATYFDGSDLVVTQVTGGARAGKSQLTADWLFMDHLESELFWLLCPDYKQGRQEMIYLRDLLSAIGNFDAERSSMPSADFQPWTLWTHTGLEIQTQTVADLEKVASRAPDRVAMIEAGQMPKEALLRALERVMEKDGKVLANGTLESSTPWYGELYTEMQKENDFHGRSFNLPSFSNVHVYPLGEKDPKFLKFTKGMPKDWVLTRYYGIPKKPEGLVHGEFSTMVHANLDRWPIPYRDVLDMIYDGAAFVQLWIDPGYATASAVEWFTIIDGICYGLKETYTSGLVTDDVINIVETDPLYKYVSHLVIDIAGRQHQAQKSPRETWIARTGLPVHDTKVHITDGILRTATFLREDPILKHPKLFLHPSMVHTIWEYTDGYRRPVDKMTGDVVGELPIDKNNHSSKAIAYGLVDNFGLAVQRTNVGAGKRFVNKRFHRRGR